MAELTDAGNTSTRFPDARTILVGEGGLPLEVFLSMPLTGL